jgi:cbb3-type cytochrome oxidase subunit 3
MRQIREKNSISFCYFFLLFLYFYFYFMLGQANKSIFGNSINRSLIWLDGQKINSVTQAEL